MKIKMSHIRLTMRILGMVLLYITLFNNKFLPVMFLVGIGVVETLLLVLVWKRKILQIFVVIVMLLTSFGLLYTEDIVARLVTYNPYTINTVSFFVLKDSSIININRAIDKRIASSSVVEPSMNTLIQTKLTELGYTQTLITFEGIQDGVDKLFNDEIDVIVLEEAYLDAILELDPEFLLKTKVIYTLQNKIVKEPMPSGVDVTKEAFTVYISGIDQPGEISVESRSDVNIVMTVNPITHSIQMVSVPRDSHVLIEKPGCYRYTGYKDKLTNLGWQGFPCMIQTLDTLMSVKINFYLKVNFSSLYRIIKVLGPIEVYNEFEFRYHDELNTVDITYPQGNITLSGMDAVYYSRARKSVGGLGGDIQRGKNQLEVIKGVVRKLISLSTLTKTESILKAVSGSIDTNMTSSEIFALVRTQIQDLQPWTMNANALSGSGALVTTTPYGGERWVYNLNEDSIAAVSKILTDNLIIPVEENAQ